MFNSFFPLLFPAEGDLATFVQIKNHFQTNRPIQTSLFTPSTRSENLQQLYDAAAKTPVNAMEDLDRILGQQDRRSSDIFLCTPVLGQSRKRIKTNCNLDIETGRVCVPIFVLLLFYLRVKYAAKIISACLAVS